MSIKTRLEKLEQRPQEIDIETMNKRIRELVGQGLGLDLSGCHDAELEVHTLDWLKQTVAQDTGQDCSDWPYHRLLSKLRIIVDAEEYANIR